MFVGLGSLCFPLLLVLAGPCRHSRHVVPAVGLARGGSIVVVHPIFERGGRGVLRGSHEVPHVFERHTVGTLPLGRDGKDDRGCSPAIALVFMPMWPTTRVSGVSKVPPTLFTPWTAAMPPFSRQTITTLWGSVQQSTYF